MSTCALEFRNPQKVIDAADSDLTTAALCHVGNAKSAPAAISLPRRCGQHADVGWVFARQEPCGMHRVQFAVRLAQARQRVESPHIATDLHEIPISMADFSLSLRVSR